VIFLDTPIGNFLIPGDIEAPAWEKLLQDSAFRDHLSKVNVFIASHHGRTSGYCGEVFDHCQPKVVVFSDGPVKYATQKETDTYAAHALGVTFKGGSRKVLTTRRDRSISWPL